MPEEEKQASVPYFIHEGMMTKMYRIIKILAWLLVAALAIFVINNVIWMGYVERQRAEYAIEEVADAGVYQQPDQGTDR